MCCNGKPPGGNCYRVSLGKNEWLQSHREVHRCILCFLDFLLYLFYTLGVLVLVFIAYLLCVAIGFPIVKATVKDYDTDKYIWGLGFAFGLGILGLAVIVILGLFIICSDWRTCITSDDYLLPVREKEKSYEKIGQTEPGTNQIELESLSLEQIQ